MRHLQSLLLQEIWRKTEKENENESWQKLAMHSRKHHRSIISMHACWTKSNRPCFCRYNLGRYWPFCISFSIREAPPSSTLSLSTFLKFVVICYLSRGWGGGFIWKTVICTLQPERLVNGLSDFARPPKSRHVRGKARLGRPMGSTHWSNEECMIVWYARNRKKKKTKMNHDRN